MLGLISCKQLTISPSTDNNLTKVDYFKSDINHFNKINHTLSDFKGILNAANPKEAWPKIHISFTFGGFNGPNNPCIGGANCGSCIGLCIQVTRESKLVFAAPTPQELEEGVKLLDWQDLPNEKLIVLYPSSTFDNGDGYFYIDGDHEFSDEVNNFVGRDIKFKSGAYLIDYSSTNPFGAVIVETY